MLDVLGCFIIVDLWIQRIYSAYIYIICWLFTKVGMYPNKPHTHKLLQGSKQGYRVTWKTCVINLFSISTIGYRSVANSPVQRKVGRQWTHIQQRWISPVHLLLISGVGMFIPANFLLFGMLYRLFNLTDCVPENHLRKITKSLLFHETSSLTQTYPLVIPMIDLFSISHYYPRPSGGKAHIPSSRYPLDGSSSDMMIQKYSIVIVTLW